MIREADRRLIERKPGDLRGTERRFEGADCAERVAQYEHRTRLRRNDGDDVVDLFLETVRRRIAAGTVRPPIHRADAEL
jgi:hypothetical protein